MYNYIIRNGKTLYIALGLTSLSDVPERSDLESLWCLRSTRFSCAIFEQKKTLFFIQAQSTDRPLPDEFRNLEPLLFLASQ